MARFRTWLEQQDKTQIFSSKECEKAAALYAAGRGSEAEQILSNMPPQIRQAMMQLFEKGFPKPKDLDATARAIIDPKFHQWVQSKLLPTIKGDKPDA